jgi:uncharacterized protein YecT (DUF1311 family)
MQGLEDYLLVYRKTFFLLYLLNVHGKICLGIYLKQVNPYQSMKSIFLIFLLFNSSLLLHAQKNKVKIKKNIQDSSYKFIANLKKQTYLKYANRINCDSHSGSILEYRICANLELQKQDSLLTLEFDSLIKEFLILNEIKRVKKMKVAQEIWEKYRFAQCNVHIDEDGGSAQMIAFMECATEITLQRRKDIKKLNY